MANNIPWYIQPYERQDHHIPQIVVARRIDGARYDPEPNSDFWKWIAEDHGDLFLWLTDKKIQVVIEKMYLPHVDETCYIFTALFLNRTDLMECLMRFEIQDRIPV